MARSSGEIRLTEWTTCGGCAAKWGPLPLADLVAQLAGDADPGLLVGLSPSDDAAVLLLDSETALVSTTDFFPPLVDDPSDFGAIAAANACSDVFAMGGRVVLALNISAFPETMPLDVIATILTSAAATVTEAGGVVAGGHTIRSDEVIFGLAVQGLVHPDRIWSKAGARPGDVLVLSKPLGTGIVLAGGTDEAKATAIEGMRRLNADAAAALAGLSGGPHGVTDVTGFGLAGHAWEMAERGDCEFRFEAGRLPFYPGALDAARAGTRTGGDARNRSHLSSHVMSDGVDEALMALVYDPQTSGGLLAAVDEGHLESLGDFTLVGSVVAGEAAVVFE